MSESAKDAGVHRVLSRVTEALRSALGIEEGVDLDPVWAVGQLVSRVKPEPACKKHSLISCPDCRKQETKSELTRAEDRARSYKDLWDKQSARIAVLCDKLGAPHMSFHDIDTLEARVNVVMKPWLETIMTAGDPPSLVWSCTCECGRCGGLFMHDCGLPGCAGPAKGAAK